MEVSTINQSIRRKNEQTEIRALFGVNYLRIGRRRRVDNIWSVEERVAGRELRE